MTLMLPLVTAINFGPTEWVIAIALIVLLFGATKIPELARSLGKAKAEYQKASTEGEREIARERAKSGKPDEDEEDEANATREPRA